MDKTQKERILHALQRLEQNVGKVSYAIVMFNLPSIFAQNCRGYEIHSVKTVTMVNLVADQSLLIKIITDLSLSQTIYVLY